MGIFLHTATHTLNSNIRRSYRPGLPTILKKIRMDIAEGEHIGIIGRTGAGKSRCVRHTFMEILRSYYLRCSIMVALYRLVELSSGSITLDGVDISTIGLTDLRIKIASECILDCGL
jgi:ATP-binding cassette, subfamily C (CFTR/MRP), member 1